MANSRYKFFEDIWNADFQHYQKSFPTINLYTLFGGLDSTSYTIPITRAYRPDLIALDFYGDPALFWVLVYANKFQESPADFVPNLVIQVPRFDRVMGTI
jgi:hypothetical protein